MLTMCWSRGAHLSSLLEQMGVGMGYRSEDFAGPSRVVIGVSPYNISKSASGLFCQETQKLDVRAMSTLWEICHRICVIITVDSELE